MRIISSLGEMTETARGWLAGGSVGLVHMMSHFHEGHRLLVQTAREACETSVVCLLDTSGKPIGNGQGTLSHNHTRDLQLLSDTGVDIVFIPRHEDLFPDDLITYVIPDALVTKQTTSSHTRTMRNFATMIIKLFHLVRPDIAYFGQKDAQKVAIVRKMVQDLNLDLTVSVLPTVREHDGLAVSGRNTLLTTAERRAASILYRALLFGKELIEQGERLASVVEQAVRTVAQSEALVKVEQVSVCNPDTLAATTEILPGSLLIIAAYIGEIYLVDNIAWLHHGRWRI